MKGIICDVQDFKRTAALERANNFYWTSLHNILRFMAIIRSSGVCNGPYRITYGQYVVALRELFGNFNILENNYRNSQLQHAGKAQFVPYISQGYRNTNFSKLILGTYRRSSTFRSAKQQWVQ